jgi:hypothetical protein
MTARLSYRRQPVAGPGIAWGTTAGDCKAEGT